MQVGTSQSDDGVDLCQSALHNKCLPGVIHRSMSLAPLLWKRQRKSSAFFSDTLTLSILVTGIQRMGD